MLEVEYAVTKPQQDNKGFRIVGLMCLGIFLCMVDTTIMNITLPAIQLDFHESLDKMSWVLNAYTISIAVFSIPLGRLAEIFGKGKFYVLGLIVFGIGSALCAFATSGESLILFRFIQSIGAAILFPTSMIIGVSAVSMEKRAIALGMLGVTQGFSAAIGPTIGGVITQFLNWTWVFWVNVPLCVIGVFLCFRWLNLRVEQKIKVKIDFLGVLFSCICIFLLTLVLVKGESWGWNSFEAWLCYVVSFISLAIFLIVEKKVQNPMIKLQLFKNRIFTSAALTTVLSNIFLIGVTVLLPTFLTRMQGKTELTAALMVTPISGMIFIFAPLSSIITRKLGVCFMVITGFIVMAASYIFLRQLSLDSTMINVLMISAMLGVGYGLITGPMTEMGASSFEGEILTASQSVLSMLRQLGIVLAIAIFVSGLSHNLSVQQNRILDYAQTRLSEMDVEQALKDKVYSSFKQNLYQSSLQSSTQANQQNNTFTVTKEQREALISENVKIEMEKIPSNQKAAAKEAVTKAVTENVDNTIKKNTDQINTFINDMKLYSKKSLALGFGNLYNSAVPFVCLSSLLGFLFFGVRLKKIKG
ncbi:MFS transporter [Paenibacillus sp. CGMCC 1.18879]|uniref:MFS transporter n=3 Tax=Paenibacillus TaxID=44249 RepID=UPI001CA93393|nr:MFS transporter [Paenibacillus sp. CGMCC 1.18879]